MLLAFALHSAIGGAGHWESLLAANVTHSPRLSCEDTIENAADGEGNGNGQRT